MSEWEYAKSLIDEIPASRIYSVVCYLQGAAVRDETPNEETIAAFQEIANGGGTRFQGTAKELFQELLEE